MKKFVIKSLMNYIKNSKQYSEEELETIEYGISNLYLQITKTIVITTIAIILSLSSSMFSSSMSSSRSSSSELILIFGGIFVVVLLAIHMYKNYMSDLSGEIASMEVNEFHNELNDLGKFFK